MGELDLDHFYVCPDCGAVSPGEDLLYHTTEDTLFVCPGCGCVQEYKELERQLGFNEEEV